MGSREAGDAVRRSAVRTSTAVRSQATTVGEGAGSGSTEMQPPPAVQVVKGIGQGPGSQGASPVPVVAAEADGRKVASGPPAASAPPPGVHFQLEEASELVACGGAALRGAGAAERRRPRAATPARTLHRSGGRMRTSLRARGLR